VDLGTSLLSIIRVMTAVGILLTNFGVGSFLASLANSSQRLFSCTSQGKSGPCWCPLTGLIIGLAVIYSSCAVVVRELYSGARDEVQRREYQSVLASIVAEGGCTGGWHCRSGWLRVPCRIRRVVWRFGVLAGLLCSFPIRLWIQLL
jgi:hypothetical protein